VEPAGGPVAHRGDQAGQHALSGQEDLLAQQPAVRPPEQHRRGHVVGPGPAVEPRQQQEMPGLGGEVPVPVPGAELRGVPPAHRQVPVAGQRPRIVDLELAGYRRCDRRWYRGRVGQKRADRAHRHQLDAVSQARDLVGATPRQLPVAGTQVTGPAHPVPIHLVRERGVGGQRGRIYDHGHGLPSR